MKYENEIREILYKIITVTIPTDEITYETNLQDIGINSLTFVRLIIEIEGFFNIEFPHDKLIISELGTIKELCKMVDAIILNYE